MKEYHIAVSGEQHGPLGETELRAKTASGEIDPYTLVWTESMDDWQEASAVPELKPLLKAAEAKRAAAEAAAAEAAAAAVEKELKQWEAVVNAVKASVSLTGAALFGSNNAIEQDVLERVKEAWADGDRDCSIFAMRAVMNVHIYDYGPSLSSVKNFFNSAKKTAKNLGLVEDRETRMRKDLEARFAQIGLKSPAG